MIVNGIELEDHNLQTKDGYLLKLLRIPVTQKSSEIKTEDDDGLRDEKASLTPKPAVLLVHGLNSCGTTWLLDSAEKVLPCKLAAEGFDCWLASLRGTHLSKGHATLNTKSKKYWNFSVDEMAEFDIIEMIDYILEKTGNSSLYCVGHSLGSSVLFGSVIIRPEYNSKIKFMAALSPAIYGTYVTNKTVKAMANLGAYFGKFKTLYRKETFPLTFAEYGRKFCLPFGNPEKLGVWLMMKISKSCESIGTDQVEKFRRPMISEHIASSTSLKTYSQIGQCLKSSQFRKYHYGRRENLKRYNQPTPPIYDLKDVTFPVVTFGSVCDKLIPAKDVIQVSKELGNLIEYREIGSENKFTHADFPFGKDAHKLVYDPIIEIFKNFENVTHL